MSEVSDLQEYINNWGGYDLHETDLGLFPVAEWEGFPVRRYRYKKTDPDGTQKAGEVALLDASQEQIANWVHSAIVDVCGDYDLNKARKLVDECGGASGFQFPVRGIHWENMTATFTGYTFFNGVTVRLNGWNPSWPTQALSQAQIEQALSATFDDVVEAMKYARIQSTTRTDYKNNGGLLPVEGKSWLEVVRTCYQAAWNSDRNELMVAKARSIF